MIYNNDDVVFVVDTVRRCPVHGTVISSPCGNFDGLCGECEADGYDEAMAAEAKQ